jgi:glycosyltransferase involved in cell wall biosynthesis
MSFQLSSLFAGMLKIKRPDVIICLSPPLFVCFTGVFLKFLYRCRLILNIADLWPESGVKFGVIKNKILIATAVWVEEFFYDKADGIACQTMGILNNIRLRTKTKDFFWFRNGVDFSFYEKCCVVPPLLESLKRINADVIIGYAGLIGYAQGLEILVKASEILTGRISVKFLVIGDGPKLADLKEAVLNAGLDNFVFIGNQPKETIASYLAYVDATIVPLIRTDLYLGALPSKIFDSFAVKKAVLLGVDGEAKELFVDRFKCAYYYEPEDYKALADLIVKISTDKADLVSKGLLGYNIMFDEFNREKINADMISFIEKVCN